MTIPSGNLPPGLRLSLPSSEWTVTGTPTKAGSYPFTMQFTRPGTSSSARPTPGSITLKDSLGGSVTIPLTVNTKYS
jgi:hypothetical protein